MKKYCEIHGEYEAEEIIIAGKKIFSMCPMCGDENEQTMKEQEEEERIRVIEETKAKSNIPARFKDITLADYKVESEKQEKVFKIVKNYLDNYDEVRNTGSSLFLCGKFGTGKTMLAIAVLNELIISGKSTGVYTTTMRMIRDIRSSYRGGKHTEQEMIDRYINTPLLILDEIGVQFGTDGEKILLFEVINGRYENYRPTILISNLSVAGITEYLGERVIDRLRSKSGSLVILDWESWRNKS